MAIKFILSSKTNGKEAFNDSEKQTNTVHAFLEDSTKRLNAFIYFSGTASYYLVQYRIRNRLAYTGSADTYTPWGQWTAIPVSSGHSYSALYKVGKNSDKRVMKNALQITQQDVIGANGEYDCAEIQIRFKKCNSSGTGSGSWSSATLVSTWCPTPTVNEQTGCIFDVDTGKTTIHADRNLARPVRSVSVTSVNDAAGNKHTCNFSASGEDDDGYSLVEIDQEYSAVLPLNGGSVDVTISNSDAGSYSTSINVTKVNNKDVQSLMEVPSITATDDDSGIGISVAHGTGEYEYQSVCVNYSCTDSLGQAVNGSTYLEKVGTVWTGKTPAMPYGSTVHLESVASHTITTGSTEQRYYRSSSADVHVSSKEQFNISHGDSIVWLGHNCKLTRTIKNDVETVQLASGRTMSRHGNAIPATISLSGVIIDASKRADVPSMWVDDMQAMLEHHDWILRTPDGRRFEVACTGMTQAQTKDGYISVSLAFTEV